MYLFNKKVKVFIMFFVMGSQQIFSQSDPLKEFNPMDAVYNEWYRYNPSHWPTFVSSENKKCDTFFYTDRVRYNLIEGIEEKLARDTFYIKKKDFGFMRYVLEKDTLLLSEKEKKAIINELDSINREGWPDNLFPQSRVINVGETDRLISKVMETKEPIETKLCDRYYTFFKPIFFRNNKFCLFFSGHSDLISYVGECWFYKKEQNGWIKFDSLFTWLEFPGL